MVATGLAEKKSFTQLNDLMNNLLVVDEQKKRNQIKIQIRSKFIQLYRTINNLKNRIKTLQSKGRRKRKDHPISESTMRKRKKEVVEACNNSIRLMKVEKSNVLIDLIEQMTEEEKKKLICKFSPIKEFKKQMSFEIYKQKGGTIGAVFRQDKAGISDTKFQMLEADDQKLGFNFFFFF